MCVWEGLWIARSLFFGGGISHNYTVTEFLIIVLSSEVEGFLYMKTLKPLLKTIE